MLNLFQHLIPLFLFLFLACAELNVNFVEGYLYCDVLSEVEVSHSMTSPFLY
ncbi:MAG: hypothetical protein J5709_11215 [Bacteroidales bacterium]|nr:hypothetical protein [Bacteroidales bacterium]